MEQTIIDLLVSLVQNYPWFSSVLLVLGIARALFKPLVAVVDAYVNQTETPDDNAAVERFKQGKVYFVLDYVFSIKIPNKLL